MMETSQELKVVVTARLRVVARIKGHQLTNPEAFKHEFVVPNEMVVPEDYLNKKALNQVITVMAETSVRAAYAAHVQELLRTDMRIKKAIGGTAWSVELMDLSRSMPGDPLGLLIPKKAGKTNKMFKRRCNGRLFTHECTNDVTKDSGVNASGFCSKCYFPGVEAAYEKYKESRTAGLTKRESALSTGFEPYPFVKEQV